ncbi:SDR family oxidoreductase [Maribacter sp. 2307ULW6-5]|uniref:SDR family oxidoreductase n=1 Tax=Maribacter sp. 2307ULW6-5 TaxID=3386275 RepID=UPI0039BD147A
MKLYNNTILITGGSSGIGLALSKHFVQTGNRVIICGRCPEKLERAKEQCSELHLYQCDVSDRGQIDLLVSHIKHKFGELNVLINNAAMVHRVNFLETKGVLEMAAAEMKSNFLGPIGLIYELFPVLSSNRHAAIINVTTGLVYTPRALYPFYNATKAALHSFTQVLRKQTEGSNVEIIEVLFPAVNTPWHGGSPPKIAISTEQAVTEMINGLSREKTEIRVAGVRLLYLLSRIAPKFAFMKVNRLA